MENGRWKGSRHVAWVIFNAALKAEQIAPLAAVATATATATGTDCLLSTQTALTLAQLDLHSEAHS